MQTNTLDIKAGNISMKFMYKFPKCSTGEMKKNGVIFGPPS